MVVVVMVMGVGVLMWWFGGGELWWWWLWLWLVDQAWEPLWLHLGSHSLAQAAVVLHYLISPRFHGQIA